MIKFDKKLLKGKPIERLDEYYFRVNPNTDEIELTPFAEDKIAKAMKSFYGNALKKLSLAADDMTYLTKSKDIKQVKNEEATKKLEELYEVQYAKEYPLITEELERLEQEYKESHPDEFEEIEVLDSSTYYDEDTNDYKSSGGNLYELTCTSIKEAAIGYQTASEFLKDNPLDKSAAPMKKMKVAIDRKDWENTVRQMREQILSKPEFSHLPKDIFKPVVYKEDYSYSINWRATGKESSDATMLTDAANAYLESMM